MIVCLDVDYHTDDSAVVAAIVFDRFDSDTITESHCVTVKNIYPYIPGEFYKRELPCLMAVLKEIKSTIDLIIVDSYVWLAQDVPGMGHHLYEKLGKVIPIIGCAKTHFKTDNVSTSITRGISKTPLYITSVGMNELDAAKYITQMHGDNRLPTLLKQVDRMCREYNTPCISDL